MTAITFPSLVGKVATHRNNNKIPIGDDLAAEIENWICQNMELADQIAHCSKGRRLPKSVHWGYIESFLKFVGAHIQNGGKLVEQSEAERRAAICAKCPLNMGISGCGVCRSTVNAFKADILQRHTEQDAVLQACGVCGCENKSQVHVPIEVLRKSSDKDYSVNPQCWKLRGGVNESTE